MRSPYPNYNNAHLILFPLKANELIDVIQDITGLNLASSEFTYV